MGGEKREGEIGEGGELWTRVEKGKREIRGQEKEGGWRKAREVGGRRGKGEEKGHGQELNPLPAW